MLRHPCQDRTTLIISDHSIHLMSQHTQDAPSHSNHYMKLPAQNQLRNNLSSPLLPGYWGTPYTLHLTWVSGERAQGTLTSYHVLSIYNPHAKIVLPHK